MADQVEILISNSYGGFSLSSERRQEFLEMGLLSDQNDLGDSVKFRSDPRLIQIFKEKGAEYLSNKRFFDQCTIFVIESVPKLYYDYGVVCINEYDGFETIGIDYALLKSRLFEEFLATRYPTVRAEAADYIKMMMDKAK